MKNPLNDAIAQLDSARAAQVSVVTHEQAKLAQLEQAIAQLQHTVLVIDPEHLPKRTDYEHLGPTEAAKRWLEEVGTPQHTEDIAKALLERGIKTKSNRYTPNVYSSMKNSAMFFRVGEGKDGVWRLRTTEDPQHVAPADRNKWHKKGRK